MRTNLEVFNQEEFGKWAEASELLPAEEYLLDEYLTRPLSGRKKDARILEAGSGGGRLLFALYARGFRSLEGFDLSAPLLARAEERRRTLGADTVRFFQADVSRLDLPDASYDAALYLGRVLCFVDDEARASAVRECFRILKPGGGSSPAFSTSRDGRSSTTRSRRWSR